jgi:hypothetical protein
MVGDALGKSLLGKPKNGREDRMKKGFRELCGWKLRVSVYTAAITRWKYKSRGI